MRSFIVLLITLGVLLNFVHADDSNSLSSDAKRAKFRGLNRKRALIGDILSFQGGDLISLFSNRYELGTSYGQLNNNDYVINSHNTQNPSTEPDFPFDGFFDDNDFLDDPDFPGDDDDFLGGDNSLGGDDFPGDNDFFGGDDFSDDPEDSDFLDETT